MKKSLAKLSIFLCAVLVALSFAACKPRIRLPEDKSLSGANQWLVISSVYAQMKSAPSIAAGDLGLLRRATVLQIFGSAYSTDDRDRGSLWFKVQSAGQDAWISAIDSSTYSSQIQADNAAAKMK